MTTFKPLLPPRAVPRDRGDGPTPLPDSTSSLSPMVRDNLTLSSWLLLGGLVQGCAFLLLGSLSLLPTAAILLYRTIDHLLMACHITPNRYLAGSIPIKRSAQYPRPDGTFSSEPAGESIVVFHLGARNHHPLGMFAPGMKELGDSAEKMQRDMRANPVKYGLLGSSQWLKCDSAAGNEFMTVFYLRDYAALHQFAHDEIHMEGVRWWARIAKDHPHLALYHETYLVPRGNWENIYINGWPTGLADTWFPVQTQADKEKNTGVVEQWVRPVVDARDGVLRSASKRLQLTRLEAREKEHDDMYNQPEGL